MDFKELQSRLVALLKSRLRNGELSERRMAHLTGISQPHIHNVLKGVRILSPRAADRILRSFQLTVLDLLRPEDSPAGLCTRCSGPDRFAEVPVLGCLAGAGPSSSARIDQPGVTSLSSTVYRLARTPFGGATGAGCAHGRDIPGK